MSAYLHVSRLYHGRCVSISDVRCRPQCRQCGDEEHAEAHQIVFVRAGVFVKQSGRRELVADPNQVLFLNRHEPYRVSHPVGDGDDCTAFAFRSEVLREAVEAFAPRVSWERPFGYNMGSVLENGYKRHHPAVATRRRGCNSRCRRVMRLRSCHGVRMGIPKGLPSANKSLSRVTMASA